MATLYADSETLGNEENGYQKFVSSDASTGVIPDSGVSQQDLPAWSDIRDAAELVIDSGQGILNGATDTFTETADFVEDELDDAIDEAYEQTEPLFDAVEYTPTPDKEPPQDLVDSVNELGADYVETIDFDRTATPSASR